MDSETPASIGGLEPGVVYIVKKSFTDYHGARFEVGRALTFEMRSYFAYHGGHTLHFRETLIALQEDDQLEILDSLSDYFAVHDASGRRAPSKAGGFRPGSDPSLKYFIGGLLMVAMCVGCFAIDRRTWVWAGLGVAFFGAITFMEARALWDAYRRRK